jgi:hypothetical protein
MKISHFLFLALISATVILISCNSKKDAETTQDPMTTTTDGAVQDPSATTAPATATSGGTEKHYKCTKEGCTGSGDAQGKCPICGSDLVHNAAFHAQTAGAPGTSPVNPVQIDPSSTNPTTGSTTTPAPPPAKNAKGEYHYTCPNGHEGGATAGKCAKCGTDLVHNQAYHNN